MRVFFFQLAAASGETAAIASDPGKIVDSMTGAWAFNNILVKDGAYSSQRQSFSIGSGDSVVFVAKDKATLVKGLKSVPLKVVVKSTSQGASLAVKVGNYSVLNPKITAARTIYAVKGGGGTIGADTMSGRLQETSHLKLKQRGAVVQVANYVSFPSNGLGSEIKTQAAEVALATIGAVVEGMLDDRLKAPVEAMGLAVG